MNKAIKELIAKNKLSDEDILRLLSAEPPAADEEQEENDAEDEDASEDPEDPADVDPGSTIENQKELFTKLISDIMDKKLKEMKSGKPKPKVTAKNPRKPPKAPINTDSFQLI